MYHNVLNSSAPEGFLEHSISISSQDFERQLIILQRIFNIIPLERYLGARRKSNDMAITFDDGTLATYEAIEPILLKLNIPATIFITTGHLEDGHILWDYYLNALCFEGIYSKIKVNNVWLSLFNPSERRKAKNFIFNITDSIENADVFKKKLINKYPITDEILEYYRGMTIAQVVKAAQNPLISIGGHSVNHQSLSRLHRKDQEHEISHSLTTLTNISGELVTSFAYPNGDYNHRTLEILNDLGVKYALAVSSKNLGQPRFEIERLGVFSPSVLKLLAKIILRTLRIR